MSSTIAVDKKSSTIAAQRLGGKEIDDLLNGFVGAMVGGFELSGRLVMGVGAVVKAAVGERAAEPFVKEQEEQGDLNPFWRETVGVAGSVTLQQPVGFELAQVVTELVEPVGAVGEVEGGEDGVVDLLGGPAADLTTVVQQDLEQGTDLRAVISILAGQLGGDDLSSVGVHADMELSPGPTRPCGVLLDEPLTGTAEFEPCAVHQQVYRFAARSWSRHRQCRAPSADRRMVWRREIKTKQPKHGCDQPFGLA